MERQERLGDILAFPRSHPSNSHNILTLPILFILLSAFLSFLASAYRFSHLNPIHSFKFSPFSPPALLTPLAPLSFHFLTFHPFHSLKVLTLLTQSSHPPFSHFSSLATFSLFHPSQFLILLTLLRSRCGSRSTVDV